MALRKIILLPATIRPGRLADRVIIAAKKIVEEQGMEPIVIDPIDYPFEVCSEPIFFMKDPTKAPEWMLEILEKIKSCDGFIVLSAEYNCSIPPALSNMLAHFPQSSFRHRPCGIISYSTANYGGIRATVILRPFLSELSMITTPYYFAIPEVTEAIQEDGTIVRDRVRKNITRVVDEVKWYADALTTHREKTPGPLDKDRP